VVSNGVAEEPISSELVLVDEALARRARAALPDPPWLLPALAELRERPEAERAEAPAPVAEPPAPSPDRRRRPSAGSVVLVVIALAFAAVSALAFVPLKRGPSLVTTPVEQAAPAEPVRPPAVTPTKPATKPKSRPLQRAAKPKKARQAPAPATKTRTTRRASAPSPKPKPQPRTLTRAQRVVSWQRYPAAVYYSVYLQRGTTTLFQTRTVRRSAVLPAHLALRPGTYHVVVRPAIPNDAGIILGPAIFRKTVRL
jgi:hypothetical protein